MKHHHNKKGTVLLYLIVTMTVLTALGTGLFYMTTTSAFSGLGVGAQNKARYLAEAGLRYALANLRTLQNTSSPLPEYKLSNAAADKFILEVSNLRSGVDANIKSSGIVNPGTPFQASHKISIDITPAQYQPLTSAPVDFARTDSGGIKSMTPSMTPTEAEKSGVGKSGATGVYVDTGAKQIKLGMSITQTYGCVWYQGWANSNGSDCIGGKCKFNKGIRAYFDFEYVIPWDDTGPGFTFAIINGQNNDYQDCGGGDLTGNNQYMAYAGPGATGDGLQPPKIAAEFDPRLNYAGDLSMCNSNSRNDDTFSLSKHSTFVYWGDNLNHCFPSKNTYDDNRHGDGGSTGNPKNPDGNDTNIDGTFPFFPVSSGFDVFGYATPTVGRLSFRLEIDRIDDPVSAGDNNTYKLQAWIMPYNSNGYPDGSGVTLYDTSLHYNKNSDVSKRPTFQQTITLNHTWHGMFDRIIFGWTQATGARVQNVIISNFKVDFKNMNDF